MRLNTTIFTNHCSLNTYELLLIMSQTTLRCNVWFRLGLISDYVRLSLAEFKLPVFPGCQLSIQLSTLMGRLTAHYQLTISYMHQLYRSFLRVGLIVHTYTTYSYLALICLTLKIYHYLHRP